MVVPTLGERPKFLRQTLESIREQDGVAYDIVMIFPLKSKPTMDLAKEYGAIVVEDPGGISSAVNAGIAQAQSCHTYIGWIGDDDLLRKDSLKTAIELLETKPTAVLAYGYCDYIDDKGNKILTSRAGNFAPWIMTWGPNLVPCPGIVFRKSTLNKAGKFDEKLNYSMDLDMLLRLRELGRFINTKKTLAAFRWHPTSTTVANRENSLAEAEKVKRKHLAQPLRLVAPLWEPGVRFATKVAANRVNKKALGN